MSLDVMGLGQRGPRKGTPLFLVLLFLRRLWQVEFVLVWFPYGSAGDVEVAQFADKNISDGCLGFLNCFRLCEVRSAAECAVRRGVRIVDAVDHDGSSFW